MSYSVWGLVGMRCDVYQITHPMRSSALRLAYYRLHGHTMPIYEIALTRSFCHDFTETLPSIPRESFAFVRLCVYVGLKSVLENTRPRGNQHEADFGVSSALAWTDLTVWKIGMEANRGMKDSHSRVKMAKHLRQMTAR
ncbi:hypothetical protein V8B97DRAFT_332534 [Scleroderma yunnanense]